MRKQLKKQVAAWLICLSPCLLFAAGSGPLKFRTASPSARRALAEHHQAKTELLTSGGTITGMLVNVTPEALESALVYVWNERPSEVFYDDSLLYKAVSPADSNGLFSVSGLAPGLYYIQATADGYLDIYYDGLRGAPDLKDAIPLSVEEGTMIDGIELDMIANPFQNGRVSGRVIDAETQEPVQNADVSVFCKNFYCFNYATTDENGEYTVENLVNDTSYVQVNATGYVSQYYNHAAVMEEATLIVVSDTLEVTGIDFQLEHGSSISGTITDSSGHPLENVFVQAFTELNDSIGWIEPLDAEFGYYADNSGKDGAYTISGLPEGEYYIKGEYYADWSTHTAYYPGVTHAEDAIPVAVNQNSEVTGIDFQIRIRPAVGVIEGQVVDTNGNPVKGAVMSLGAYPPWRSSRWYWEQTETDSSGRYRLENIPDDQYTVECLYRNAWESLYYFWPGTRNIEEAEPVTISDAQPAHENIDFQLPITLSQASISGQVCATDGHPLANAQIRLLSTEDATNNERVSRTTVWVYTDSSGHYVMDHIPTGPYVLQCQLWEGDLFGTQWYDHAESRDDATTLLIQENSRLTHIDFNLTLKPLYGSLSGVILDQKNQPVQNAYVEVIPFYTYMTMAPDYDRMNVLLNTTTDENGQYNFPRLHHDNYIVTAYANGGYAIYPDAIVWEQAEPVAIAGGESSTADFTLLISDYPASIQGRITSKQEEWTDPCEDSTEVSFGKISEIGLETFVVTAKPLITILSWPESEKIYSAVTTPEGDYTLSCPPGAYIVQAFSSGYFPVYYDNVFEFTKATTVTASEGNPAENIDIVMVPKFYWLVEDSGHYRGDAHRIYGCIEDEDGNAVPGATIFLYNADGNPVFSATTNEQGYYDISGMQSGDYYIQALKAGIGSVFNGNAGSMDETAPLNLEGESEVNLVMTGSTGVSGDVLKLPDTVRLMGNHPNPFNPQTEIRFALPDSRHASLSIYNALGQRLVFLVDRELQAGEHRFIWNGDDRNGNPVPSGLYFCRLTAGEAVRTQKMVLIR